MCGIIGILSLKNTINNTIISSIDRLSYRGYDSAGIAMIAQDGSLDCVKAIGPIDALKQKIDSECDIKNKKHKVGIAHTRWATHGLVNLDNCHPHCTDKVAVVHNGVIENYHEVKKELLSEGVVFKSQTDTELIPILITKYINSGMSYKDAIVKMSRKLYGTMAILVIFKDEPHKLFGYKQGAPMIASFNKDKTSFALSSDVYGVADISDYYIKINDNEIVLFDNDKYNIYDSSNKLLDKEIYEVDKSMIDSGSKGEYATYMMKEIHEQSEVILNTINYFYNISTHEFVFQKKLTEPRPRIIKIIGCGSSFISASIGRYWLSKFSGISAQVVAASEARYDPDPSEIYDYFLYISQSGETADILSAANEIKSHVKKLFFAITNNAYSSLASLSDDVILTKAGVEISVAATKTLTTQMMIFALLSLYLGQQFKTLSNEQFQAHIKDLLSIPRKIKALLENHIVINAIKDASKKLAKQKSVLYIGRGAYYQIAAEGALKLKELSYIFADSLEGGELKHGPIALVDKDSYLIILLPKNELYDKMIVTIEEISARDANIIIITDSKEAAQRFSALALKITVITIGDEHLEISSPFLFIVIAQLIAYYTAKELGNDIDRPRNLAKSVTVA